MARDQLTPREYAERALGKAASAEQLDKLFQLHPDAYPIVEHGRIRKRRNHNVPVPCCTVCILSWKPNPGRAKEKAPSVVASATAVCNPRDQWNRRIGLSIAFGRAFKTLSQRFVEEYGAREGVAS